MYLIKPNETFFDLKDYLILALQQKKLPRGIKDKQIKAEVNFIHHTGAIGDSLTVFGSTDNTYRTVRLLHSQQ